MSSLVIFPFNNADPEIFTRNIQTALSHPAIGAILCIGSEKNESYRSIANLATGEPRLNVMLRHRLGNRRSCKGDRMNTGLQFFQEHCEYERLHYYDAEIPNFTDDWIASAEEAAEEGYQVVRQHSRRTSTDAMITWMLTRTGFALTAPYTQLAQVQQPLAGSFLLTREVADTLAQDLKVLAHSDWGVNTVYAWKMFHYGFSLYELYQEPRELPRLSDQPEDIQTKVAECFAAIQTLREEQLTARAILHDVHAPTVIPETTKQETTYEIEDTLKLLAEDWTERQTTLLDYFPNTIRKPMLQCRTNPAFLFMDEAAWFQTYHILLDHFELDDSDWHSLLFKLWVARVLNCTTQTMNNSHEFAIDYLEEMVEQYRLEALRKLQSSYRSRRRRKRLKLASAG